MTADALRELLGNTDEAQVNKEAKPAVCGTEAHAGVLR